MRRVREERMKFLQDTERAYISIDALHLRHMPLSGYLRVASQAPPPHRGVLPRKRVALLPLTWLIKISPESFFWLSVLLLALVRIIESPPSRLLEVFPAARRPPLSCNWLQSSRRHSIPRLLSDQHAQSPTPKRLPYIGAPYLATIHLPDS